MQSPIFGLISILISWQWYAETSEVSKAQTNRGSEVMCTLGVGETTTPQNIADISTVLIGWMEKYMKSVHKVVLET